MARNQFAGFGGGPNIQQLMRQAQKMQEQMQKAQEELDERYTKPARAAAWSPARCPASGSCWN